MPLLDAQQAQQPIPREAIDAYIAMAQQAQQPARDQFQIADALGNTDQGTLENDLASLYNTYGAPQGQFNAFDRNAQGGFDDPAVGLIDQFAKLRENYRQYIGAKAPGLVQAYAPYLGGEGGAGGGGQALPGQQPTQQPDWQQFAPQDQTSLNPYYSTSTRPQGWT